MATAETVMTVYSWVKRMAARQRKTLVVCDRCHRDIHRDRSGWRERTGHWKAG